jgi:hypothetical protein
MHTGFHSDLARDRQSQLLRDADFAKPAAAHMRVGEASRRAEDAPRKGPMRSATRLMPLNPGSRLGLALSEMLRTRSGLPASS